MFTRKTGIGAAIAAAFTGVSTAALAAPINYQLGFQEAASDIMVRIEEFHHLLVYIIVAICVFVLALLVWIVLRYRASANPIPSKTHHNTLLEVAWTIIPVIVLVLVAIPSFRLLYLEHDIPKADVTIKAIGKQWFWSYQYPGLGDFTFDSLGLSDEDAKAAGKPRLLGVDNAIYVPVNKNIDIETTGADVIHSWALPEMGVKMDAVPGRINHTWFRATKTGIFYGQCSELCGARHAYMPIEVHVVTDAEYAAWLADAKTKYATLDTPDATRVASR
jgi:cytochrome c oxidase subunit 2